MEHEMETELPLNSFSHEDVMSNRVITGCAQDKLPQAICFQRMDTTD